MSSVKKKSKASKAVSMSTALSPSVAAATGGGTGSGSDSDEGADVKTAANVDGKTAVPRLLTVAKQLIRAGLKGSKGRSGNEITVWLSYNLQSGSAAATPYNTVTQVRPGLAGDFANLAGLYDELICTAVDSRWRAYLGTVTQTAGCDWAVAYDPINAGTYSSVNGVMEARQFFGPIGLAGQSGNTGIVGSPQCVTSTGFVHFYVKIPRGASLYDPSTPNAVGTGHWTSTNVTTTAYGYFKPYVEAAGAGVTFITCHFRMKCTFRSRT